MSDLAAIVRRYIDSWNQPDAQERRGIIAEIWAPDGTYTDPLADVRGHAAIDAVIAGARDMFPGHVFALAGGVDTHHDIARFGWELVPAGGGDPLVVGFDVAVAEDGLLRGVYGFLDMAPALGLRSGGWVSATLHSGHPPRRVGGHVDG
jgi:SnoaL-like domain